MSPRNYLANLWSARIRPFLGAAKYRAGGPLRWVQDWSAVPMGMFHGGPTPAIARLHALYPLTPARVLAGYAQGIFPTGQANGKIVWHCPNPRAVIRTDQVHVSKRLKGYLRNHRFEVCFNRAFDAVVRACADREKTWITDEIIDTYNSLHEMKFAHSVETYLAGQLVGGGYGVALGQVFFLESMFCRKDHASKIAFVRLAEKLHADGFTIIDCQFMTEHWRRFGAQPVSPEDFQQAVATSLRAPAEFSEPSVYVPLPSGAVVIDSPQPVI